MGFACDVPGADPAACRAASGSQLKRPFEVTLVGRPRTLELRFRVRSFRDHPLTAADLNDRSITCACRGQAAGVYVLIS